MAQIAGRPLWHLAAVRHGVIGNLGQWIDSTDAPSGGHRRQGYRRLSDEALDPGNAGHTEAAQ